MTVDIIALHAEGQTRDQIIIALVSEDGMTLNAATKAYAEAAKSEGWATGRESHKEAALEWLAESYTDETWTAEAVKHAVLDVSEKFGVTESTARDYCRAFSEDLGVTHPVADPRKAMFDWLIENDGMPVDEMKAAFKEFGKELGRSSSNVNEYWKGYELHLALVAAKA